MGSSRIFYGLALLPLVAVLLFAALRPLKVLPRIRISPGYLLVDQNGNRVSSEEMRGQITLYGFTSTDCGPACAGAEGVMADVAAQLEPQADVPVELVTRQLCFGTLADLTRFSGYFDAQTGNSRLFSQPIVGL